MARVRPRVATGQEGAYEDGFLAPPSVVKGRGGNGETWRSEAFEHQLLARLTAIERKLDAALGTAAAAAAAAAAAPPTADGRRTSLEALANATRAAPRPQAVAYPEPPDAPVPRRQDRPQPAAAVAAPELPGSCADWAAATTGLGGGGGLRGARTVPAEEAAPEESPASWLPPGEVEESSQAPTSGSPRSSAAPSPREGTLRREGSQSTRLTQRTQLTWACLPDQRYSWIRRLVRRSGLHETIRGVLFSTDDVTSKMGWSLLHGGPFNLFVSLVIILNSFFIGLSASRELRAQIEGEPAPEWLKVMDIIFSMFFVAELILRLVVERLLFFCGPEWRWNMFDAALVVESIIDMTVPGNSVSNVVLARVLRLARFSRLARLTRVIRQFDSLRLMLMAILDSMSSLFWCFVIIGLVQYVFAIMFVNAATEYFSMQEAEEEGAGGSASDDTARSLQSDYGGIYRAWISLFMVISGGADWRDLMKPLLAASPLYGPLFIFYVFVMHFGVLNVVIGTFVATATEIASKDREAIVKYEIRQMEGYTNRIRTFFHEADMDNSGTLSWEEFSAHLENRKVKAYFQALDLDVSQAHLLFELLDADGSDQVTIDEFLDGCMRLKGNAKSIDLNTLILMVRKGNEAIMAFVPRAEARLQAVEDRIGVSPRVELETQKKRTQAGVLD